jgi:hypothetical protein
MILCVEKLHPAKDANRRTFLYELTGGEAFGLPPS